MIDIAIFALPADRKHAEAILDALHETRIAGPNRTRLVVEDPRDPGWTQAARLTESAACAVFCWSRATRAQDPAPLLALASRMLNAGHALSVELDAGSLPDLMRGSTTYPLHGWRSHVTGWGAFFFGNSYLQQIAVAAARKASGQDPPPPQAFWSLVRTRAWVAVVGLVAVLGAVSTVWGAYNDDDIAKLLDREGERAFAAARQARDCAALRKLIAEDDGAWKKDAQTLLAGCRKVSRTRMVAEEKFLPAFGATRAEAEKDAKRLCEGYAKTVNGRLTAAVRLEAFEANVSATAHCTLQAPESYEVEVMETAA